MVVNTCKADANRRKGILDFSSFTEEAKTSVSAASLKRIFCSTAHPDIWLVKLSVSDAIFFSCSFWSASWRHFRTLQICLSLQSFGMTLSVFTSKCTSSRLLGRHKYLTKTTSTPPIQHNNKKGKILDLLEWASPRFSQLNPKERRQMTRRLFHKSSKSSSLHSKRRAQTRRIFFFFSNSFRTLVGWAPDCGLMAYGYGWGSRNLC